MRALFGRFVLSAFPFKSNLLSKHFADLLHKLGTILRAFLQAALFSLLFRSGMDSGERICAILGPTESVRLPRRPTDSTASRQ